MSIVGPTEVSVSWNVAPVSSDPITYEIKYTLVNSGNPSSRTETITSSMATVTKTISGKFVVVVLFVLLFIIIKISILDCIHFCNFLFTFNHSMCRSDAK